MLQLADSRVEASRNVLITLYKDQLDRVDFLPKKWRAVADHSP